MGEDHFETDEMLRKEREASKKAQKKRYGWDKMTVKEKFEFLYDFLADRGTL